MSMKKNTKLRRFLFGIMAGVTVFSSVVSSASGYTTESGQRSESVGTAGYVALDEGTGPAVELKVDTEPETDRAPEPKSERETEGKPETELGPQLETKLEPETGSEPEAESEFETGDQANPEPGTEPESEPETGSEFGTGDQSSPEPGTGSESEGTSESEPEPESASESEPESERMSESESETESDSEPESESESETETEEEGAYQVTVTKGKEFDVELNHEDGTYDAGELVRFSVDMPNGNLTAAAALKVKANRITDTADLLYSEITYQPSSDTFCFEMPEDDIELEVQADYVVGGMMLLAEEDETPWDEATDLEADTYYYYSDGKLHPFDSAMGKGGNDSYKYVRYKVNGKTYTVNAYCMQHSKASPPSGTTYRNMTELDEGGDDAYLRKALFYGYGGPGWGSTFNGHNIQQIMKAAGCSSETRAMQHYLVDYLYDGESGFGGALSAKAKNMLREIKAALADMPDPTAMELLPRLSAASVGRVTESFTWKADPAFTITVHLEDGVELVNETTGKTESGSGTVRGGERFHLVAVADRVSSLKGMYEITSNYPLNFHAMLLKLKSSQDIGFGYYTETSKLALEVTWTEDLRGSLEICKEGEVLSGADVTEQGTVFSYEVRRQPGAVYDVYAGADILDCSGKVVYPAGAVIAQNLTTGAGGSVILSDLYPGTYTIKETHAPQNLICNGEEKTVTLTCENPDASMNIEQVVFRNERQKAAVSVKKTDEATQNPLSGGMFGLYAAEEIRNADSVSIVPRDTLIEQVTTGADGAAAFRTDIPAGFRYSIREVQAPHGYVRNTQDQYVFTFAYTKDTEPVLSFSHTFVNQRVNAVLHLMKRDVQTGKAQGDAVLEGAVYGLYARENIVHPDGKTGIIYSAGTQVATLTTDREGNASAKELYPGSYFIRELKAPEGYVLDETEHEVTCVPDGDLAATIERTVLVEEQVIRQPFQIIKAANSGQTDAGLLAGAGFTAYLVSALKVQEDGSYDFASAEPVAIGKDGVTELFTDSQGHAVSEPLPFGTYLVRETTTPSNFKPVKDFLVRITEHSPTTPQVWRVLLDEAFSAKLKIIKQDDETKRPVLAAGTEFKVFDLGRNCYVEQVTTYPTVVRHTSYFTDECGYLILPQNLTAGRYRIEEMTAPEGYTVNRSSTEIAVDADTMYRIDPVSGDTVIEVIYENHPVKAELTIVKKGEVLAGYDADFRYELGALAGAVFEVYAAEDIVTADFQTDTEGNRLLEYAKGDLAAEVTTDASGTAVVKNLPLGAYRIVEKTAPEGFVCAPEQTVYFTHADQETPVVYQTAEFTDERQKVQITAVKQDAESEKRLAGAEFGLYAKEDIRTEQTVIAEAGTLLARAVTGTDGTAVFEQDLPFGTYEIRELSAPAGYLLCEEKREVVVQAQGPEIPVICLEEIFRNRPTKVSFTKSDVTTGRELCGAVLTVLDRENQVVDSWTSEKGKPHVIKGLHVGETYTLREELAPYGYLKAEEVSFTVADTDEIQKVEMKDAVPVGRILISKKGEFLEEVTWNDMVAGTMEAAWGYANRSLQSVTFEVYAAEEIRCADGEGEHYYESDELVTTIVTDVLGYARADDLPLGRYYVLEKETAEGFVLDRERREVDLTYRDQDTAVITYDEEWQNQRQRAIVTVQKKEKGSERALEGGVFALCAGETISGEEGTVLWEADTVLEQRVTDKSGSVTFSADLPVGGRYYVKEIQAPPGFVTSGEKKEFVFAYAGEDTAEVAFDFVFENEPTVFEITKSDLATGETLPGATLRITDEEGTLVEEWISGDEPHRIQELEAGRTYKLTEISAPAGYIVSEEAVFEVKNTGEIQRAEMKDDVAKGRVILDKIDRKSGKPMKGVKFALRAKDGTVLETLVTDEHGHAESGLWPIAAFEDGKMGEYIKYTLKETGTQNGYILDETEHEVCFRYMDDRTPVVECRLTLSNEKKPEKAEKDGGATPKTGDTSPVGLLFGTLLLSGIVFAVCLTVLFRRQKRR